MLKRMMSSCVAATARPVSTVRKFSLMSLARMIWMPHLFFSLSCRSMRSAVVPALTTTFLPTRSAQCLMPEFLRTSSRAPTTKKVVENDTWFCRSALLVVELHSRSTVWLATSGMRVCGVTSRVLTSSRASCRSFFTWATTRCEISQAKPACLLWSSR
ncbi:hypothetical protein D3C72_1608520 [compost metagenome]